jgi:hypothetical protein
MRKPKTVKQKLKNKGYILSEKEEIVLGELNNHRRHIDQLFLDVANIQKKLDYLKEKHLLTDNQ